MPVPRLTAAFSRSRFLAGASALAGAAVPLRVAAAPQRYELRELVARPYDLETPLQYFRSFITPTEAFFVRSHFGPPADWPPAAFALEIKGLVQKPVSLTLADLRALPSHSVTCVIQCAGNGRAFYRPRPAGAQWHWGAVGNARFTGVKLKDVIARAGGLQGSPAHLGVVPADHAPSPQTPLFNRSIPIEKALDEDTILAYDMNDAPLNVEHGGPLRLIVPGWAGDNHVKWLLSISPQTDETHGFYMDTGYRYPDVLGEPGVAIPPEKTHHVTDMPIKSIIANPLDGETVSAGHFTVQGVAFTSRGEIDRVEVSSDGGASWQPAELGPDRAKYAWRLWQADVQLKPGAATLSARAFDTAGGAQPAAQEWNPSGYFWNVYHSVGVEVRA